MTKPMVSLVTPALNEATIVESRLSRLCEYMTALEDEYDWEIVFVNDGSSDRTGEIAEKLAVADPRIRVFHHRANLGLGQGFRTAFAQCRGDYIITLDLDLSYAPDHIEAMLAKLRATGAKMVIASPYAPGGQIANVPWLRRLLSVWANRFLALTSESRISTLTGMVRAYDGRFIRSLDTRGMGMDVMPELIYKATILGAGIEEIPARLDWGLLRKEGPARRSSMRMMRHMISTLLAGFVFRPFMFFLVPGLLMLVFAVYTNTWMFIHFFRYYGELGQYPAFFSRASAAVAAAYQQAPHTFVIAGLSTIMAIQLISLGVISLQSKHYFEEVFHLGTTLYRQSRQAEGRGEHPRGDKT